MICITIPSIVLCMESKLWPGMQSHEHSGDGADRSRSSRSRRRSLRARDEQVPELRDGTREGEEAAMGLTKTAVSEPRGALEAQGSTRHARPVDQYKRVWSRRAHRPRGTRPTQRWLQVSRSVDLCSRRFGGMATQRPKQNKRSTLASTLRLITWAGQRRARRLVSPANHAQHVSEHAAHKRTVHQ